MHGTVGNSSDNDWFNADRAFVPRVLSKGEPLVLEHVVTGLQEAIEIVGKIASSGQAELQDLIVHVDCFDADGAPVDAAETGLLKADSGRYFFYPIGLMTKKENSFCKRFITPLGAYRIQVSLSIWRNWRQFEFQAQGFDIRPVDVLHVPEGSGFSDLLSLLINQKGFDAAGRVLDVATTLPEPALTISAIARTFSLPIDCVALEPNPKQRWMDTRRMLGECRILPAPSGPYALICVYPHTFNLGSLLTQLEALVQHLSSHGFVISAVRAPEIDALPQPDGKPSDAIGQLAARITALNAECVRQMIPLEALTLAPKGSASDQYWIILRKIQLEQRFPGLYALMKKENYVGAAHLLYDELLQVVLNKGDIPTEPNIAQMFQKAAPPLEQAGKYEDAIKCYLCASALDPGAVSLRIELAARFRVRKDFTTAKTMLENILLDQPGNLGAVINQALVFSEIGRGLEAMDMVEQYLTQGGRHITPSMRRTITTLLRNFAQECQSAGHQTALQAPLLSPEIATTYLTNPEAFSQKWYHPRLIRLFQQDSIDRRIQRDLALRSKALPVEGRKLRLLVISSGAWAFVLKMIKQLNLREEDIEYRTFDFAYLEESIRKDRLHEVFAPVSMGCDPQAAWEQTVAEQSVLGTLVEWCDIVFCEWAGFPAIWLSRFLPPEKQLVIRLHSYEAFNPWPFFINFGGVDGIVFVAEHIRRFADIQFRHSAHCHNSIVLQNFNDPSTFSTEKVPGSERTLGMLGYSNLNKDTLFAARMLAKLRRHDPSWRLKLVGSPWNEATLSGSELDYYREFKDFVSENQLEEAIDYVGFVRNVGEPLSTIGFILSCSHREGTHEAILEGMASGSVPVIRRWPMVRNLGAPENSYPHLRYVDTVDEAVDLVLETAIPEEFRLASMAAAEYARKQFDAASTTNEFIEFLGQVTERRNAR